MNRPEQNAMRRPGNAGMSLLEVMASAALLGLLISLCLQMFVMHNRITALNAITLSRLEGIRAVQAEFRATTRHAVGVVDAAMGYETGAGTLVLRLPDLEGVARYCVWGTFRFPDRLSVMHLSAGETPEVERLVTLPLHVAQVRFEERAESTALASLTFEIKRDEGERVPQKQAQSYTVIAACRGVGEGAL